MDLYLVTKSMHLSPSLQIICPLDGLPLQLNGRSLSCENRHQFDIAKQGYVNLLPVQHKKSRDPGDSKEMIAARHRFLESGFYTKVSDLLNSTVLTLVQNKRTINILDAGCGEGYYLTRCVAELNKKLTEIELSALGLDISKPAILEAAKRKQPVSWTVSSNKLPPVMPESIDIVLCMFGFCDLQIMRPIIRHGGHLIIVEPGENHLIELRKIIYPSIKSYQKPSSEYPDYELVDSHALTFSLRLDKDDISDLLVMTPHLYRATSAGKEAVSKLSGLKLTVDVVMRILKRE